MEKTARGKQGWGWEGSVWLTGQHEDVGDETSCTLTVSVSGSCLWWTIALPNVTIGGSPDPCNISHNGVWLFNYIWFFFKFWVKKALKGGWIRSDILRAGELSLVFFHLQLSACRHGNKAARLHNVENCLFRLLFNFVFGNSFTYTKAAHPQKK